MSTESEPPSEERRVWLVERTYGDDELNLVILVYATPDGERYVRKERALTSFDDERPTPVSMLVSPGELGEVDDAAEGERYATEAARMRSNHDPDDTI